LLNQFIAVAVALAMAAVNGEVVRDLQIASVYSHLIGALCLLASLATLRRIDALPSRWKAPAIAALYFPAGIAGAELARRMTAIVFPWSRGEGGGIIASTAVGATVAVIVGLVLITLRQLRAQVTSTEIEALQARINPHFLFNTLNSIAALIREDPARAEAVTLRLSALFRYTLQAPRQGLVSLEEELAIVEGYLAIEQERLAERLSYGVQVDADLLQLRVPPLVLQPLVENAIKHGVAPSVAGGDVRVRGWREDDRVHLAVTDSGNGRGSVPGTGEGLESVRRRLRATFGSDATVTLSSREGLTEARLSFRSAVR
jgi:LytS/YehU family sensor histidine kinase